MNFWGKPECKRPLRKPWRTWECTTKMDLEKEWDMVDWILLAEDKEKLWAVVNTAVKLQVP
jgi:hypothetical protein